MSKGNSKKSTNSLLVLSSAAVVAVYAAGYVRTQEAADRFEKETTQRRPMRPRPTPDPEPTGVATLPAATLPASTLPNDTRPKSVEAAANRAAATTVTTEVTGSTPAPVAKAAEQPPTEVAAVTLPQATPAPAVQPVPPPAPAPPPPPPPAPAKPAFKDGVYYGWGYSRHGNIEAKVVVAEGRMSATISQCLTRYDCGIIGHLPPQVEKRQTPDVDFVSGATESANAFYYAVVSALEQAK